MQVAGAGGVHQNQPWDIAVILFSHLPYGLGPIKSCFIAKIQGRLADDIGIHLVQQTVDILHPFTLRILYHTPGCLIILAVKMAAHIAFCQIHQLKHSFFPVLIHVP